MKLHYVYRARRWWVFPSREVALQFFATAKTPGGYRLDLEPRELPYRTPPHLN